MRGLLEDDGNGNRAKSDDLTSIGGERDGEAEWKRVGYYY